MISTLEKTDKERGGGVMPNKTPPNKTQAWVLHMSLILSPSTLSDLGHFVSLRLISLLAKWKWSPTSQVCWD